MDVADWLRALDLGQYETAFHENSVTIDVLPNLTSEDLKDIGISRVGHRRRLLDAIAALRSGAAPTRDQSNRSAAPGQQPQSSISERRHISVMFCDLAGSTRLSSHLDPEDFSELIRKYQACVAGTIGRFGGFIARYVGDGVLIYFGWPEAQETDAEQAVRCGLAVIAEIGQAQIGKEKLRVRIGIASGLVVIGEPIGTGEARQQTAIGETPNLAARLQALAGPDTLVIDEATRRQVGGLFELVDLGLQALAGFAAPQPAWRVVGESEILSRFEALRSEATPLIGRDEELNLLLRRWQQAKAGEGRLVLLSGDPGIGKSRLTAALVQCIAAESHTRLRYFCSPHNQNSTLFPFAAQLERAAGLVRNESAEQKLGKLENLLAPAARGPAEIAVIAELLSLPNITAQLNLTPQRKRETLFEAFIHQLEAMVQQGPVLMIFEDVQWVDPTTRELLEIIVNRVSRMAVLLVITFRPEFQPPWTDQPHATVLALSRLGARDGTILVEDLASHVALDHEVIAEIVERTDGVPLFIEELTRAVLESREHDSRMAATLAASPPAASAVPATLHASLIARLDRLGPGAKEIAQIGAVLGREFSYELIEDVSQHSGLNLQSGLRQLTEARLLFCRGVPPQSRYLFKHALVQDAAYSSLLRARRRQLHARVAAALEQHFADLTQRQPELLARHYTEAGLIEPAIALWRRAGALSLTRSAHREALGHFGHALEILGALPEGEARDRNELDVAVAAAVPLIAIHGFGSAQVEAHAVRAKDLTNRIPHSPDRFAAHRVAWNSSLMRQPVPTTVNLAQDLMHLARMTEDMRELAIAHRALGYSLFMAGRLAEAADMLTRGVELADNIPDSEFAIYGEHPSMVCRVNGGWVRGLMGFPETAADLCEAGIAHARSQRNPHSVAWALCVVSHAYADQGEPAPALRFADEALEVAREHRLPQWLATAHAVKGWALCRLGDIHEGLASEVKGERDWRATGAVLHTARYHGMLAESYLLAGDLAAAGKHLAAARARCESHGENYMASEIYRLAALLSQAEGASSEQAEWHLNKGLGIAREQAARLPELRCATLLAKLWGEQGRRSEALDLVAHLYSWFTQGFSIADLQEAKSLLDALA